MARPHGQVLDLRYIIEYRQHASKFRQHVIGAISRKTSPVSYLLTILMAFIILVELV